MLINIHRMVLLQMHFRFRLTGNDKKTSADGDKSHDFVKQLAIKKKEAKL